MKSQFFEYHTPSKAEFDELWRTAVYSFDASVLLDLYRFSSGSREELLKLLRVRRDRTWLSHQSAYEFHKNRLQVIGEASKRASDLKSGLTSLKTTARNEFKQHPYVASELCERIGSFCEEALKELQDSEDNYPNLLSEDPIARELLDIFDGRVGNPYDPDKIENVQAQISKRYDSSIPPGYLDRKTKDERKSYGDCILWFQLIEYAKVNKTPVILVTRDLKEDWWLRDSGKTLMPRPELRREFRESTDGQDFYLYQTPTFIEHAKAFKRNSISDRLLQESRVLATESQIRRSDQNITAESRFIEHPTRTTIRHTGATNGRTTKTTADVVKLLKVLEGLLASQKLAPVSSSETATENSDSVISPALRLRSESNDPKTGTGELLDGNESKNS
jgi:hypothetical protein